MLSADDQDADRSGPPPHNATDAHWFRICRNVVFRRALCLIVVSAAAAPFPRYRPERMP
jgi:hypothetical protein